LRIRWGGVDEWDEKDGIGYRMERNGKRESKDGDTGRHGTPC